jgi:phosphonate transport system ATP-binding protein
VVIADDTLSPIQRQKTTQGGPFVHPPVITARDLWFAYDRRTAVVDGVDLDVGGSEITMILGRSGSGKTTLLKLLKGLLRPQRGTVRLHANGGRSAAGAIAYVPQTLGLVRSISALDNALTGALSRVGIARSVAKFFPGEIVDEARELITTLGLGDKLHEPAYRLSGGERQRIAIARALMQHPALILADEFVSQLDPITATEILESMRRIAHDNGVALLVTTHETDVVEGYADRVLVMRKGKLAYDAPGGALSQGDMLELLR